jgi:DNA polymerase alpha subunit B
MCQIFNLSPESLLWKWEALSYSSTRSLATFTMDSAHSLKTQIQREIAAENIRKQKVQSNLSGSMSKGRIPGSIKPIGPGIHPTSNVASATKMQPRLGVIKPEINNIAGPSRVAFKGPNNDETSRSKRTCEFAARVRSRMAKAKKLVRPLHV